jgi:hypothetical protein
MIELSFVFAGQVSGLWTVYTNHWEHICMYSSFALSAILRLAWYKTGANKSEIPIEFVDLALAMAFFGEGMTWHLHSSAHHVCTASDENCKYESHYLQGLNTMNTLNHDFLQLYANFIAAGIVLWVLLRPNDLKNQNLALGVKLFISSVVLAQGVWFYFLAIIEFGPRTQWATGKQYQKRYIGQTYFDE